MGPNQGPKGVVDIFSLSSQAPKVAGPTCQRCHEAGARRSPLPTGLVSRQVSVESPPSTHSCFPLTPSPPFTHTGWIPFH